MVILFLVLPLVIVGGLYAVDLAIPMELIDFLSGSAVFTATLSVVTLAAILVAAYRNRSNPHLMSAWLFLFCGVVILSLASLVDSFAAGSESWTEELLSAASFFPLLIFAVYISSPMRLLILSRRQRALYISAGIVVFLGVCALVLFPWLVASGGPSRHATTRHLLRLLQPVLDTILVEPLAVLVLLIGLTGGGAPYVLIGFGLLLFIPEDVLGHFRMMNELDPHNLLSNLFSMASRLYLLGGALIAIIRRDRTSRDRGYP